tara:strand:+ start:604 stop:777 length:174 start_codon:yes stop_codon:yes gene_type:complete
MAKLPPGQGGSPGQAPPKPHPGPFVPAPPRPKKAKAKDIDAFRPGTSESGQVNDNIA